MIDIGLVLVASCLLIVAGYLAHCIESDAFDEYTVLAIPAMLLCGGFGTIGLCLALTWR